MADDLAQLDELAAGLRALEKGASKAIAEEALPDVLEEVRATADAGTTPDGQPWAPTREGKRALPGAGAAITAIVSGASEAVITLILRGKYVFHHRGIGKGKGKAEAKSGTPARRILPDPRKDGVPPRIVEILQRTAARVVAERLRGGS